MPRRLELQVLESRVQEKSAEVAYLTELLGKLKLAAPYGGVAIFPDADDLRGKPVQVGERIMVIADPSLIDVTVYLPSDDAVELEAGARVVVFLHVDPLSSIDATITPLELRGHAGAGRHALLRRARRALSRACTFRESACAALRRSTPER